MTLSDLKVKAAKAGPKVQKLADGGGMFLQVETTGTKGWRISYSFNGKQNTLSLGRYPAVSLKQARGRRDDAKALLAEGVDPSTARKAAKAELNAPAAPTWREVAQEYEAKQMTRGRASATLDKLGWLLDMTYRPLGSRPIAEITAKEVLDLLVSVETTGRHETARRLRSVCGRVFRYGIATVRCERDVAADLAGALTVPMVRHHPALTDPKEIGALLRAVRSYGGVTTRAGLLLLFYTFLRPGVVREMRWSDVDFEGAMITIPAERMKGERGKQIPHKVPMSAQVIEVLRFVHQLTGRGEIILPGQGKARILSENTFNQALERLGFTGDRMVSHGFRTIASTRLNELGYNRDWIERQLAHVEGNGVRAAYNAAEYLEGRTRMMQDYADHLDSLADAPPV